MNEIERAARTSLALDKLVKKRNLDSIAYYYEGESGNEYGNIITSIITGNTNSRYRFSVGAKKFMNEWSKKGPAHHCDIGVGHIADKIQKLG